MARRTNRSSSSGKKGWQEKFLKALTEIPNLTHGCGKANVSRVTVFLYRKKHPEFEQKVQDALKAGIEGLEKACWQRAKDGVRRGVWRNDADGNPVRVEDIREYSDTLAICMLKAHAPEKYRERTETTLTGPDGQAPALLIKVVDGKLPEKKETPKP